MWEYFKALFNTQDKDIELDLKVAASISLIFIALFLTILCSFVKKDMSTITISAYGILGAHSYFSSKKDPQDRKSDEQ